MFPHSLKPTKYLNTLEKGENLLLVNGAEFRPLMINRGKKFILDFIKDIESIKETAKILERYQDEPLLKMMIDHNILVDENNLEDYRIVDTKDYTKEKKGMSLYLLLSQGCNLGCLYCLNGEETYKKSKMLMMKEEVAYKAVEMCVKKLAPGGYLEVVFFGGEPLLNWPLVKKTILYCEDVLKKKFSDRNIKYHITTNLTIFPEDFIEWIKKYCITLLCDVDGPAKIHNITRPFRNGGGSHEQVVKNIARLNKEGIKVPLRGTITAYNVDYMEDIAKHHKELDGAGSALVYVNAVTSDEDILPAKMLPDPAKYSNGLKKAFECGAWPIEDLYPFNLRMETMKPGQRTVFNCGAPYGNTPVVDVNGDVYACIYLVGIKSYKIGNVYKNDFPVKRVVNKMMDILNVDNLEDCKDCNLRYFCAGGCPVGKLTVAGNPEAEEEVKKYTKEIVCQSNKIILESLLWHYGKIGYQKMQENDEKTTVSVC